MSKSDTIVPQYLSGILELTHNHGTENLETTPYRSSNKELKGFGHIAITMPDVEVACVCFERLGVMFKKRLKDGKMNLTWFDTKLRKLDQVIKAARLMTMTAVMAVAAAVTAAGGAFPRPW